MRFLISEQIFKEFPNYSFAVVTAKDINNMTANSRDIVLKLKDAEKKFDREELTIFENSVYKNLTEKIKRKESIPNINPFINYFHSFVFEEGIVGFYLDLENIYDFIQLGFSKNGVPFLPVNSSEIVFCEDKEVIISDNHSVTHRVQKDQVGKRVNITKETKDAAIIVIKENVVGDSTKRGDWHSVKEFANVGEKLMGGIWEIHVIDQEVKQIELDYEPKRLPNDFDVLKDLNEIAKSGLRGSKGIKKRRGESLGFVNENAMLLALNEKIKEVLKRLYPDVDLENKIILSVSPDLKLGHFSTNIAFELVKVFRKNPLDIAEEIAMKLRSETGVEIFSKIEVANNGFINFFVSQEYIFNFSLEFLNSFEELSSHDVGNKRVILIESPSANPNKAMHVGHLRNVFLAQSLKAIYEKIGFEVYNDNIINDKGLPICKAMWAIQKYALDSSPELEGLKEDHFVDKYYVIGAREFKEDKQVEAEVRQLLLKWEEGDEETVKLWKKMISWVLEGHKETMKRLDEEMGHMWFESEIYEPAKEIIKESIDGERIVQTSDGAVVGKLEEEYGVPDVVLLKSDGTSLYHTQDLGLTKLKIEKFNPWRAIWVVGNEQITHFQRLFSLIDSLELLPIDNLYHLAYGYVFGKDGRKMSSRDGEVLSADELLDMIKKAVLKARGQDEKNAENVSLGALKYSFLSTDPFKDMKFDLEKAILFNGKSGPYIMYAYARACNILKNVNEEVEYKLSDLTNLDNEILLKCVDYPNIIMSSANNYSPNILAEYLYTLAKLFSQMYETEKVLDASDAKGLRVMIVSLVREILKDGLLLLRIKPLEKM
jgi:arginyl-tRNA synthetase